MKGTLQRRGRRGRAKDAMAAVRLIRLRVLCDAFASSALKCFLDLVGADPDILDRRGAGGDRGEAEIEPYRGAEGQPGDDAGDRERHLAGGRRGDVIDLAATIGAGKHRVGGSRSDRTVQ